MNQSQSPLFTKIVVGICFGLGIIGIAVFAASNFSSGGEDASLQGTVEIWGTLPESQMSKISYEYSQTAKKITIKYKQIENKNLPDKLIEAIARDAAPDMIIADENTLFPLRNYFANFDSSQMSEVTYKNIFARSTYKMYGASGVFAFPIVIDPLVMYVNTDILLNAGFQKAPKTWSDIPIFVKEVVRLNKNNKNVEQRAIAMGTFSNVLYAKEILLSLLLQLNNQVIIRDFEPLDEKGKIVYKEKYESVFGIKDIPKKLNNGSVSELTFNFFSSFINPNLEDVYTWSRRAPVDRDLFSAGNLGLYFGLASDKKYIDEKNSNLKYELAMLPVPAADSDKFLNTNYAKVYSIAMVKKNKNVALSSKILSDFSSAPVSLKIAKTLNLAPARSEDLSVSQSNVDANIIYKSAQRGDFVPEPKFRLIDTVFSQISDALSGSTLAPAEIINNAQEELSRQINNK